MRTAGKYNDSRSSPGRGVGNLSRKPSGLDFAVVPFGADVFSMIGYRWFEPPANLHTDPPGLFVFSARDGAALTRNVKRQSTCGAVQRHLVPAFPIVFGRRCNFDPKLPSVSRRAIFEHRLAQMRNRSRSSLLRLCARVAVNQPARRRVPAR